jgi:hypothetical protein
MIRVKHAGTDRLIGYAEAGTLFAVLDSCDAGWVPQFVEGMVEHATSLYRGEPEESMWAVAPYLVALDTAAVRWITTHVAQGDEGWGILIRADMSLGDLRKHLRRFLRVLAPGGEAMYFRFYDPRLLPAFLNSCTPSELAQFYGAIREFIVTDPGTRTYRSLSLQQPGQRRQIVIRRRNPTQ